MITTFEALHRLHEAKTNLSDDLKEAIEKLEYSYSLVKNVQGHNCSSCSWVDLELFDSTISFEFEPNGNGETKVYLITVDDEEVYGS